MTETYYNKKENRVMQLENKGNFIFYDHATGKLVDRTELLTLEECYNIFSNKQLETLIIKYK